MTDKTELYQKLKDAMLDLDDDLLFELLDEGIAAGLDPTEMILEGINPGLIEIGDGFENSTRFMSDLVVAGDMMNDASKKLLPLIIGSGKEIKDTMVIGTVEGDVHYIGKNVVSAMFAANGYRIIDIGENLPAAAFVKAAIEHKPNVVGCSCILSPVKSYVAVINKALVEAGIRDDLILIAGGWGFTEEQAAELGADTCGENATAAIRKVAMLRSGEMPLLKDRPKKK